jgi:hypothetical protein
MLYKKHKKYRWFSRFKEGQTSMEDEEYYGWPSTIKTYKHAERG